MALKSGSIKATARSAVPRGEQMTHEEAEALGRATAKLTIVISKTDAQL